MTDTADTYEKFSEYRRTGDRRLRNELVEEHMRLAEFLARRFAHRGEAADDLRQVALVGLLKAVERFEPDRGLQFSSFATPTITGELKRHFRDRGWAVRVPRRVQELHLELDRTVNELSQELGRPPTPAEIAQRAGVLEEDVLESMEAGSLYRLASIDAGRSDDESSPNPAQRLGEIDAELTAVDDRVAVSEMLAGAARAGAEDRVPPVLRRHDAVGDRRARSGSARCTSPVSWCVVSRPWGSTHPSSRSADA